MKWKVLSSSQTQSVLITSARFKSWLESFLCPILYCIKIKIFPVLKITVEWLLTTFICFSFVHVKLITKMNSSNWQIGFLCMGDKVRNTNKDIFIWTQLDGFILCFNCRMQFFCVALVSFKFVRHATKQNLRRVDGYLRIDLRCTDLPRF